jgi:hypothetical protein
MTWRLWMEFIIILVLTNFTTWAITLYLGKRLGERAQKYRQETGEKIDKMPYSDMFRKNELMDPDSPPPLIIRHQRRKINGRWTED